MSTSNFFNNYACVHFEIRGFATIGLLKLFHHFIRLIKTMAIKNTAISIY